ncbi:hypothetical protein ACQEV2_16625 [Streptomyces sp. CA-251387]|uniref:hypothetical protein n=1 Tax=Streptomyces sp. CA-251387 TaxID=3240064 RepID=UPI003D94B586
MRHTRTLVLTVTAAALAFTAACGAEPADESADVGSRSKTTVQGMQLPDAKVRATWPQQEVASGLAKGMRLPLEDYMLGYPDIVDVENAKDVVKSACMERLGFSYTPKPMGLEPAVSYNEMNMERRYGITDPAKAARLGFAVEQDMQSSDDEAAEEAELARQDKESSVQGWDEAMNETCIPEANEKVGVLFLTDIAGDLAGESLEATRDKPAVKTAFTAWSSCMADRGHQVKAPTDAEARFATPKTPGLKPSADEVELATDTVDCKKASNLVGAWHQAETAYQEEQVREHAKELTAEKAGNAAMVEKARAVLADAAK